MLGFLVRRGGTAKVDGYGGVQKVAPVLAGTFLFAGLATLSLPGTGNFVSEFMALAGAWSRHPIYVAISTIGMVLAAVYVLVTYRRTMTGPVQGVFADPQDSYTKALLRCDPAQIETAGLPRFRGHAYSMASGKYWPANSRSLNFWIFPLAVMGYSSRKTTYLGIL